jgi:hypothetical protein
MNYTTTTDEAAEKGHFGGDFLRGCIKSKIIVNRTKFKQ